MKLCNIAFFPVYSYTAFFKGFKKKIENLWRYSVLIELSRKKSENKTKDIRRNPPEEIP